MIELNMHHTGLPMSFNVAMICVFGERPAGKSGTEIWVGTGNEADSFVVSQTYEQVRSAIQGYYNAIR